MSLINDALKRASKTPNDPPSGPALTVGLKPVEGKSGGGGSGGGKVVLVAILLVVALGGWLIRIGLQSRAKNAAKTPATGQAAAGTNRTGTNLVAKGSATNKVAGARPPGTTTAGTTAPGRSNILTKVAATIAPYGAGEDPFKTDGSGKPVTKAGTTNAASAPGAVAAASQSASDASATGAQAWPAVKLQAIFYRLSQPSARVNGKTLLVGEDVDGVRVASIERDNVVVEYKGESKTLRFKQQQ